MLSEDEQTELKQQIQLLRDEIDRQGQQMDNLDRFVQVAGKYADLQSLTPYALRELVKAIYLEKLEPQGSKRRFNIKIRYEDPRKFCVNDNIRQCKSR